MTTITLDSESPLRVNWPRQAAGILSLGQAYVAQEAARPAEEQLPLPDLVSVQDLVAELAAAQEAFATAKVGRNVASQDRRQARDEVRPLLAEARDWLAVMHRSDLRRLGEWGFETRDRAGKITVLLPRSATALVVNLAAYVAQEQSLPEAERLTSPSLAHMIALNDIIQSKDETVRRQQAEREAKRQERDRIAKELLAALRLGFVGLVYLNGGRMDNRFQEWGYDLFTPGGA